MVDGATQAEGLAMHDVRAAVHLTGDAIEREGGDAVTRPARTKCAVPPCGIKAADAAHTPQEAPPVADREAPDQAGNSRAAPRHRSTVPAGRPRQANGAEESAHPI